MTEVIKKIVEYAVNAPSGDNAQPWKFAVQNNTLFVFNIPDADPTLYNFRQRGSFIAHGALLENIIIASSQEGYKASLELFPSSDKPNLVAIVKFESRPATNEPLYPFILKRSTNRKPYREVSLSSKHLVELLSIPLEENIKFNLLEDRKKIAELGQTLSLNERLILENYTIHEGLFSFIRWTKEAEAKQKTGLYIKTLELEAPQEFAFKLFRHWGLINFLSKFGIAKLVAKNNIKLYISSSAFGILVLDRIDDKSFVFAGRVLQRIWLHATQLGMSLQPTAALLYLAQRIESGETQAFSAGQVNLVQEAQSKIRNIFRLMSGTPAMLFRLGYSDEPSAHSLKKAPVFITL